MDFTSNESYYMWTLVFIIILGILGFFLLFAFICYVRYRYIYNKYTNERRTLKLKLIEIKDHEYTNFLR
jgi:Trk-type K+ transport system membrane component